MTKKTAIVLLSIITVLVVFFGVFTFLPEIAYGNYNIYYSPVQLIQTGSDLGDVFKGTYSVDFGDMTEDEIKDYRNTIVNILQKRLTSVYGYFDNTVSFGEDNKLYVAIPDTSVHTNAIASQIVESVVTEGYVEFTNTTSQTYSKENVIFAIDTVDKLSSGATVSRYSSGTQRYYIVNVNLTAEGKELVNSKVTPSTSSAAAYCAVDGVTKYAMYYNSATSNTMQIYTDSSSSAEMLASYFNAGYIDATITELDTEVISQNMPIAAIIGYIFLAVLVAFCVFCGVRYRLFGIAITLSFAIAVVLVTIFSGLAYFSLLNVYAVVGFILGLTVMCYSTIYVFEKMRYQLVNGTKIKTALHSSFNKSWLRLLIVNGALLIIGIILWLIPTVATVPMGNALVYSAVMSFVVSFGLNRLLAMMVKPLVGNGNAFGAKVKE